MSRKEQIFEQLQRTQNMFNDFKKQEEENKKFVEEHIELFEKYGDVIPLINNIIDKRFQRFLRNKDQEKIQKALIEVKEFQKNNIDILQKYSDFIMNASLEEIETIKKEALMIKNLGELQKEVEKKESEGFYYG